MNRREFVAVAGANSLALSAAAGTPARLGIDLFSLRSAKWTPIQYLDYCAAQRVSVVHFSEVRFLGSLDRSNLEAVRKHAAALNIDVEIGMRSICPSTRSKMFDASQGTAEEQLNKMLDAAVTVGSPIVRAVLGSSDDRKGGHIEDRMEDTVRVLHNVKARANSLKIKIAIENHAGDMRADELKTLVEKAGPDFVGVCLDSGNPLWTLEDPHLTLEVLHPYVLTSHLRDSAVWETPEGAAVTWVQMGRGNVNIDAYVRDYIKLCPGKPLSLESIVLGPKMFKYRTREFWEPYRSVPAWEFARFLDIAERGKPYPDEPWEAKDEADRQRLALEESLTYTRKLIAAS